MTFPKGSVFFEMLSFLKDCDFYDELQLYRRNLSFLNNCDFSKEQNI